MPTKLQTTDGITKAEQMWENSYAAQSDDWLVSRRPVLHLKQLSILEYIKSKVHLVCEVIIHFIINGILFQGFYVTLNLWIFKILEQILIHQTDNVYKEKKENVIKFLDDNYCSKDLQGFCCVLDDYSNCNVTDVCHCVGTNFKIELILKKHRVVQKVKVFEEMLEKKISCNGSTAATTLINLNANVNKSNATATTSSGNTSNSNNKSSTTSSGGANALETSASKPVDGMAIKTEDKSSRNTCKTEKDSEKNEQLNVSSSNNGPSATASPTSSATSNALPVTNTTGNATTNVSNVNGKPTGEKSVNASPEVSPQSREIKNEGGGAQQQAPFMENQGDKKESVAPGNKGTVTPVSCTSAIKTEVIPNTGANISPACGRVIPPCPPNIGPGGGPGLPPGQPNPGPGGGPPTPAISIQPLPSNMVNKSSTSIESQYMQQQSQIFVFSTGLANKAAEAVLSEHYPSIIAFHCAQPGTVRFLEKHPLKVQQFHRQSSAMWLNNLAQMKQGNRQMKLGPMNPVQSSLVHHQYPGGPCGQCHGPCNQPGHGPGPRMPMVGARVPGPIHQGMCGPQDFGMGPRGNWNHPMNGANMNCDPRFQMQQGNRPMFHPGMGPHCGDPMGGEYPCNSDNMGPCTNLDSTKLNSVKVPDENLTPEQRQHRKEQLVILRNLGQLLLPDLHSPGGNEPPHNSQSPMMSNHHMLGNPQGMMPHCHNEMCNHPGAHPLQHQGCSNNMEGVKHPLSPAMANHFAQQKAALQGPNCPSGDPNDWQRLNHFYDDGNSKCGGPSVPQSPQAMNQNQPPPLSHHPITPQSGIKQQPSLSSSSPTVGASPNSTIRVQGPPPPYHQGSRCPVLSPHPASPSTVSLSSPHMASGLPSPVDPSRSFPHPPTSTNRLSHPSPSGGSLHSTPLSSPKPSNPGNSGTSGTLPKTSSTPIPISTPNNLAPSPGSAVSTTASGTNRKRATTPGSVNQQSVDMDYGPLSQPLTPSSDGMMFGSNRSLHLCGQSPRATPKPVEAMGGQPCPGKEPSLMPVPSPQQIQYLNTFEGQELTIQKQPNTGLRETEMLSQNVPPNGADPAVNPNCPPFSGPDMQRNSFGNMPGPGPGPGPGPCTSSLCSCSDGPHPRFPQMNNGDSMSRMYPGQHPGMQQMEGPMHRFRGGAPPNNMNFHNQVPGAMPRFAAAGPGMDHHRYRGPHVQNEMGPTRFPTNFGAPQRMDGMMIRNQFIPGNGNPEPVLHRQYSSPGPSNMQMFEGHPPHTQNLPNLQKMSGPFDHSKTASPLGSGMGGDDSSSGMGVSGGSQRLSHFDPIASMTAMSDSALASPGLNRNQNPNSPVMNVPNIHMGNSPVGCNPGQGMNFNPNAQSMHVNQSNNNNMMHGQQGMPFGGIGQQQGQNLSPAPRQNNTFVNASMSIQQMNIQNATTSNYNHGQSMSPGPSMMQMQQQQQQQVPCPGAGPPMGPGGNTISSPATSNHPIMHSGVGGGGKTGGPRNGNNLQQFPGSPVGVPKRGSSPLPQGSPAMLPRNPGAVGSPGYMSPNVHVKASAPNTIQYLPARPQNCSSVSNRPPSLDFLQRYASPLTNLDSKVPTHNLQYFPSAGPPNNGPNGMQLPNPGGDMPLAGPAHDLDAQSRAMAQMNRNPMNFMGGPPTPNAMGQPMSAASPMLSDPNDFNRTTGVPMGNNGPNMNNSMVNMGSVNSPLGGMFHSNKNLPLSPSGLAPDTTQPLPSSMGQTLNYKQSPFYGPTTADPNYAVQFHNFQQQLYATNTRGNQGNNQNVSANPSFFNLK